MNYNKYTFKNYDGMNRLTGTGEAILQPDSPNDESQYQPSTQDEYLTINVYDTLTSSIVNNLFNPPADYYSGPNYTRGNIVSSAYRTRSTDNWNFKYYRYDERERVIKLWNVIDGLPTKTISYTYNSQDQITNVYYNTGTDYKRYIYRYDFAGRLDTVNYYYGEEGTDVSSLYKNFTNYEYNENSLVRHQNYGGNFLTNSYTYNNRNWVTELYNSISQFVFNNDYYKNGNVNTQYFYGSYRDNFTNTDEIYFTYSYDRSNRLTNVSNEITQDNTYHIENTYDRDGNITKLIRYGDTNTLKDNFIYEYNSGTNKLNNVSGSKDQFSYDYNGNMIDDKLNVNYDIKYDYRNLITELYHKEGQAPTRITLYATRYYFDETGNRMRKLIYTNLDETAGPVLDWNNLNNPGNGWVLDQNEYYLRGVYGNELATYKDTTLVEWYVYGNDLVGKIKGTTGYYYYKDHLGSVRAIVNDNGELVSAQDYDGWGYLLQNRIFDSDSTKFKFTSKERDEESEYDYFGARYYDARIGRWGTIDPLIEKHYDFSPYNYVLDNPLIFYDQDGRDPYRKYLGSKEQVMNVIEQNKGKNYYEISTVFEKSTVRYIYTEKGGFIDLRHFFFAAFLSSFNSEQEAIIFMEGLEHGQFMFGNESANDPEDRPSNLVGARYGKNTDENDNYTNFKYFLEDQIIVDPSDPSISSEKIYIPYDENDVPLPARVSYKPYRGESLKNDDIKGTGKY